MKEVPAQFVVVTPVYEDIEACGKLFSELSSSYGSDNFNVVAVDDGSIYEPLDLSAFNQAGINGVIIKLKHNIGHQRAIAVGLSYVADHASDAKHIIVMDSDGEDTPASIEILLDAIESPNVDIVVSERKSRVETVKFILFYIGYKKLFRLLTGRTISFGNFMAIKQSALKRLVAMPEIWIHIAGCVLFSKLRVKKRPIDRGPRYAGKSKMRFVNLALHGFKGLMIFSEDVLVRVGIACASVAILSIIGMVLAIVLKLFGIATPGWFSIALGILFLVFLQTGALTLISLLLTGMVKGGTPVGKIGYQELIDTVIYAHPGRDSD